MIYKLTNQVGLLLFLKTTLEALQRLLLSFVTATGLVVWGKRCERLSDAYPSALMQFFDPVIPSPLQGIQKTPSILKYFGQDSVFG